jgi:pyruvate/2-oxoglutarate dehydrogenase complex dihydrolipoamide dehydrogenase (E3) component
VVVIGGGAAGLVTSYIAAAAKAKVTLVEAAHMGGDCLNFGCVPSKALIHIARVAHQTRRAAALGLGLAPPQVDFAAVMARVRAAVAEVAPHDSVERYTALGVEVVLGRARIVSPWTVEVDLPDGPRQISTRAIVIAAGAEPLVPPIPGLAEVGCLTSDTLWSLREPPRRLLVLGGGPIGCELAQAFARLGSQVTVLEMQPRILLREDADVAEVVAQALRADGVTLLTGHKVLRVAQDGARKWVLGEQAGAQPGEQVEVEFDTLLCALGRTPRTRGYGLEELGLPLTPNRPLQVDATLQTLYPNIYACGDVAGPYQFTHTAAHQAWTAAVNALLGGWWRFKSDLSVIPWVTFTDPEVAHVGLNITEARDKNIAFELTRYTLAELDRAITEDATQGFIQVLTVPGKDKILGVSIVGQHAGELLAEFTLAMRRGLGLGAILGTVHPYPTWSEAAKATAGVWKRAQVSPRTLALAERLWSWRRGEGWR